MNKNILLTLLSAIVFLTSACGNFFDSKTAPAPNSPSEIPGSGSTILFAEVREKIFVPFCIQCHVQYGDYTFVQQDLKNIKTAVNQNRMPKNQSPLSSEQKQLLAEWISSGAQNEAVVSVQPPTAEPQGLQPTWDSLYKNIFVPKCVVCHSPTGPANWVDVSSRAGMTKTLLKHIDFKNIENSNLILRLKDPEEPMPPLPPDSNIPQLTTEEVQIVIEWIEAGLP
jgi:uncharacterized membrane protein